jgi:hypothetical protein
MNTLLRHNVNGFLSGLALEATIGLLSMELDADAHPNKDGDDMPQLRQKRGRSRTMMPFSTSAISWQRCSLSCASSEGAATHFQINRVAGVEDVVIEAVNDKDAPLLSSHCCPRILARPANRDTVRPKKLQWQA